MKLPPSSGERPWRTDAALDVFRRPTSPDDIEVRFVFWEQHSTESMWVTLCAVDPAVDGYIGVLSGRTLTPGAPPQGSLVSVRVAPGCPQPMWVSAPMRANRARWKSVCGACAFDMVLSPAEHIAATQFPEAPDGCVPVKFTTPCPMCGETMTVDTRV